MIMSGTLVSVDFGREIDLAGRLLAINDDLVLHGGHALGLDEETGTIRLLHGIEKTAATPERLEVELAAMAARARGLSAAFEADRTAFHAAELESLSDSAEYLTRV